MRGDLDRALAGHHLADHLTGTHVGALVQAVGGPEHTGAWRHHDPECGGRLVSGDRAVPGDQVAGGGQVVRRVQRDDLRGTVALELAFYQA
nr:hypothetical protein GCM10020092_088970 [Actinoplanes digitatis]